MITQFEFITLKRNIDKLLELSERMNSIRTEIMGEYNNEGSFDIEFVTKFNNLNNCGDYIKSIEELEMFIENLLEGDLYNLFIAFSIGRVGIETNDTYSEYLEQLEKAKKLCSDKIYLKNNFLDIKYEYLKKYLIKGLNYFNELI